MHSLFLRFFLSFWLAMVLVAGGTVVATLWNAGQQLAVERQMQQQLAHDASEVLEAEGSAGLHAWLQRSSLLAREQRRPALLYVLDTQGRDLLGRRVPGRLLAAIGRGPFQNAASRPAFADEQLFAKLTSPEGEDFYLSLSRPQPTGPWGLLGSSYVPSVAALLIGLLVSAGVCYLLARYLSAPIRRLREATQLLAAGQLGVQVAGAMRRRRDEVALLAFDFDAMSVRLQALLEARQQLLRDVSHELRSPLARLQIALGLARRPGASLKQELDRIEQESQRLDELIGEILNLCRLDDPAKPMERELVAIDELLDQVVDSARMEAEPRHVSIDWQAEDTLRVSGSRELLLRAVENVLRNAVRHSPAGGTVEVHAVRANSSIEVAVADRGPGVPAELLPRIFEPFFRVGTARDRDSGGNGIGLAITARVLSAHGGEARAANREGGGLRVLLSLPAQPENSPAAHSG